MKNVLTDTKTGRNLCYVSDSKEGINLTTTVLHLQQKMQYNRCTSIDIKHIRFKNLKNQTGTGVSVSYSGTFMGCLTEIQTEIPSFYVSGYVNPGNNKLIYEGLLHDV